MKLRVVRVAAPGGTYPIHIGRGALARVNELAPGERGPSRVHVVSDRRVFRRHGSALSRRLERLGAPISRTLVPPGETSKSVVQLERIWRDAVRAGCDRRSWLVAFGGGVVGDLTGFAAASLLRGVPLIQVPTTLLAMVDSSVGGKTGINLAEGKNLVGAFHQPRAVLMDPQFLSTLPPREVRAGWAEVIKTAAIRDVRLFRLLERQASRLLGLDEVLVSRAVERSVSIKARVVETDERESGLRMILNFGHTLAHAVEAVQGYGGLLHGEAVAVGMVFAARLGERLGITRPGVALRLETLLADLGLPTRIPGERPAALLGAMARDKKRGERGLRWVLLRRLGQAEVVEGAPAEVVRQELDRFLQRG